MAQDQATDERLRGVAGDPRAFADAVNAGLDADIAWAKPFMDRGLARFMPRQSVCLAHCGMFIRGAGTVSAMEGDRHGVKHAWQLGMAVATSGSIGRETATSLLALGYALALADLAAVPPDGEAITGS